MSTRRTQVEGTIRSFLARSKKQNKAIELDTSLYSEGLGLDSLETAELSAVLEDELGSDPFSNGEVPQTVREIIDFYDSKEPSA